jgi:uncharacterized protein (TIGR02271 family)
MPDQQEVATIPLVEERVVVTKREVETGRLRIKVSVDAREEIFPVELSASEMEVERVPINTVVSQVPAVRLEGSTTIIPVVEEVVVVEKRLVLVEEIHVRRKTTTETKQVPVTIRTERVQIDRSGSADRMENAADAGDYA